VEGGGGAKSPLSEIRSPHGRLSPTLIVFFFFFFHLFLRSSCSIMIEDDDRLFFVS
jgi:hypothetical protein